MFSARRAYFENTFCKSVIRVLLMNTLPRERISYILWICLWLAYTEGSWKGIVLTKLYSFKLNSIQRKSIEHNLGGAIINHILSNSLYKLILQMRYYNLSNANLKYYQFLNVIRILINSIQCSIEIIWWKCICGLMPESKFLVEYNFEKLPSLAI